MNATMLKKLSIFCITCLAVVLTLASGSYAQPQPLLAAGDSDQIILRWVWPEGSLQAPEYKIYRQKTGTGRWELLTPQPIRKIKDQAAAEKILGEELYQKYRTVLFPQLPNRDKEPGKYREAILKLKELWGMTMLSADLYPKLATLLGVRYEDFSAAEKTTYIYRLMQLTDTGEQLAGLSLPVSRGEANIIPPQGVQGRAADGVVLLRWQIESRFTAYDIYRSDTREGTYQKVNKNPVVILKTTDEQGKVRLPDWFYVDQNLKNGHTYWYTLWGRDPFGRFSRVPRPIALTPKDMTPPAAPLDFKTEVNKEDVTLTWTKAIEEDCVGYNLYRSLNYQEGFEKINAKLLKTNKPRFVDKNLKAEAIYWYYATAVDSSDNESSRSYTAPAEVRDLVPPTPPKNLAGKVEPGKVLLSWDTNPEEDLVGYRVYQAMAADAESYHQLQLDPIPASTFVHTLSKAASANPYFYKVTAVDRSGNESDFSQIIKLKLPDVTPPFPPVFAKAEGGEGEILLTWHPNIDKDLAGYQLYRLEKKEPISAVLLLNQKLIPAETLKYKDSANLIAGTRYAYTLKAVDQDGNISLASRPLIAASYDLSPPDQPTELEAEQAEKEPLVNLKWRLPTAKDLKGVLLSRGTAPEGPFYPLTETVRASSYVDKDVRTGKTYYYRLAAYDQKNNKSADSRIVKVEIKTAE